MAFPAEHTLGFLIQSEQIERVVAATIVLYLTLTAASLSLRYSNAARGSRTLKDQVNSWWYIFPIVTLSLALYPFGPVALVVMIGLLAVRELSSHFSVRRRRITLAGAGFVLLTVLLAWMQAEVVLGGPVLLLSVLYLAFIARRTRTSLLTFLVVMVGYGLSFVIHFLYLPFAPEKNLAWLFYLFVVTALNDVGQFIFGKLLGRHRIASTISPNKTCEGLAGGVLVTMLVSLWLGSFLQLAAPPGLILTAGLLSIGGFVGDLSFSAAKRFIGVKDFSDLIPGHGGILDRVDSLILTAPLLYFSVLLLN